MVLAKRRINKAYMRLLRASNHPQRLCLCDLCHTRTGSEMHEIIPRSRTMGNERARALSYEAEVCSLLCQRCHQQVQGHEQELWQFNIDLHGRQSVLRVIEEIERLLKTPLNLDFPEED